MTRKKDLISWLNDAYSMELSLEETLQRHLKHFDGFPQLRERLEQHILETRGQANQIKGCIEKLGGKVSRTKAVFGEIMGRMQGYATSMFDDEVVKSVLMEYAAEHFEIACYESLATAAEELGETEVARICREILEEEQAMAEWLKEQIPLATKEFLHEKHASAV